MKVIALFWSLSCWALALAAGCDGVVFTEEPSASIIAPSGSDPAQSSPTGSDPASPSSGDPSQQDPPAVCGNSAVETGEICDGGTRDCAQIDPKWTSGTATCGKDCKAWDTGACAEAMTVEQARATISKDRLKEVLYKLCSTELNGRSAGSPGDKLAAEYIAAKYLEAGLSPGNPKNTANPWFQPFNAGTRATQNVVGILPGNDPVLKDEYIVVGGHMDTVGVGYLGANDNASGTTHPIELAFAVGKLKGQNKRSIVFMGFGAEELGLLGSNHYCKKEPIYPIQKTVLMMNFDMTGRYSQYDAGYGEPPQLEDEFLQYLYAEEQMTPVDPAAIPKGTDSAPFRSVGVKLKDYCCAMDPDYHTKRDTPDKINFDSMLRIAREAFDILWKTAQNTKSPTPLSPSELVLKISLDHGGAPFLN